MPKYEITVRIWDEYVIEVNAEDLEKAKKIAIETCEEGYNSDGGRDIQEICILNDECDENDDDDDDEDNIVKYGIDFLQIGDFEIGTYHEQDCCENVYADFNALQDTTFEDTIKGIGKITKEKIIENIEKNEYGIRIFGFFIPCYNKQNGYYSGNLELVLFYKNKEIYTLDITDCTLYEED